MFRHQSSVFMALAMNYCICFLQLNARVQNFNLNNKLQQQTHGHTFSTQGSSTNFYKHSKQSPLKLNFEIKFTLIMKHTSRNVFQC